MEFAMKKNILLVAAGIVALTPAALAGPGHGGGNGQGEMMRESHMNMDRPDTRMSQGPINGTGWDHMNGPEQTGQPGVECEEMRHGHSSTAPGSAFNEEGRAGTKYAGEQPQNSRNTASISQYDVACVHQPQR
jgi:hypothetical protein